jgi:flagellin
LSAEELGSAAAAARIMDIDQAREIADLTRASILLDQATAILAQANLQPSLVLALLGEEEKDRS